MSSNHILSDEVCTFFHKALQESGYFKLQTVKLVFDFEFIQVCDHNYLHN